MKTNILLTGATGYIGNLLTGLFLTRSDAHLYLLVRPHHSINEILKSIEKELTQQKVHFDPTAVAQRITLLYLPENNEFEQLSEDLLKQNLPITEIVHAAGYVEYFDKELLEKINIGYTKELIQYGKQINLKRFIFISTAYAAGYTEDIIEEALLPEPKEDPTEYTRTKRAAEKIIARSGLPFLILRPSNVIGDSRDGHYFGKRYGLYQQWLVYERLLCKKYYAELPFFATDAPLNFIHQDAFLESFWAAYQKLPNNSWLNMVTHKEKEISGKQLAHMWMVDVSRPQKVIYFKNFDDLPLSKIPVPIRAFLNFSKTNAFIASHHWNFSTKNLDTLIKEGLNYVDVTLETIHINQDEFVKHSEKLQEFIKQYHPTAPKPDEIIEVSNANCCHPERSEGSPST